jgi:hypothetical protein
MVQKDPWCGQLKDSEDRRGLLKAWRMLNEERAKLRGTAMISFCGVPIVWAVLLRRGAALNGANGAIRSVETGLSSPVLTVYTSVAIIITFEELAVDDNGSPKQTNKQTPWPLVRERTIPTDRPPLVDEI